MTFFDGLGLTNFHLGHKNDPNATFNLSTRSNCLFEILMHTKVCLDTILTSGHLLQSVVYVIF